MPLYQLTIHRRRGASRDKVEDNATEYLISLERTGQVWDGQWVYSCRGEKLTFYVEVARTNRYRGN